MRPEFLQGMATDLTPYLSGALGLNQLRVWEKAMAAMDIAGEKIANMSDEHREEWVVYQKVLELVDFSNMLSTEGKEMPKFKPPLTLQHVSDQVEELVDKM